MQFYIVLFVSNLLFWLNLTPVNKPVSGYEVAKSMFAKTKEIKTLGYTMRKLERVEGQMTEQVTEVKLSYNPFKVYTKQTAPKYGLELLYVEGTNNNMALINPNGFPWVNLNLDPYGSVMRKKQHHTIHESGYFHLVSILEFLFDKYKDKTKTMITDPVSTVWNSTECWKIEFKNPNFGYRQYTVQENETILTIAQKYKLSEYMIMENNKRKDYNDVYKGLVLTIPNDYSPNMIMYIDKKNNVPLMIQVKDDKGLFEQYEYSKVSINPTWSADEFSKNYKGYGF